MQKVLEIIALSLNIPAVCIIALALLIGWAVFGAYSYRKMRRISIGFLIVTALAILYVTILSRSRISTTVFQVPFSTFQRAQMNSELLVFLLMNMIMFIPVGFTLPFVLYGKPAGRVLWTIFIGFFFSCVIEVMQELFSIGYTDIDDIIVNTLGTAIGSLSYLLTVGLRKLRKTDSQDVRTTPPDRSLLPIEIDANA